MACSVCKEKGHDKRQCPIEREKIKEEITFRRERLNLFLAKAPELLANPVFMGLLWFQLSRTSLLLSEANTLILAGDAVGLNIPEGASLGAIIQKAENVPEYLEKIKGASSPPYTKGLGPSGLLEDLTNWLTSQYTEFEEGLEYKPQL